MINLSLKQLAKILQITSPTTDVTFTGVATDNRKVKSGDLFIAIKGEKVDGHDFINAAQQAGAVAALVDHLVSTTLPCLLATDVIAALGKWGAYWRNQFNLPIIAITGSNGKTTTKNMIASIMHHACHGDDNLYLATQGNLNSNIGMPLNLFRLTKQHRYAILEMGMNHLGEIYELTQMAKPTVAAITNVTAAHLLNFNSVDEIAKAKGEIFAGLATDGIAVLNADDHYYDYWKDLVGKRKIFSFGINNSALFYATKIQTNFDVTTFEIVTPQGNILINLPLLGRHNILNALAATAAAVAIGIDLKFIKTGLETVKPEPKRLQKKVTQSGAIILDDSYNANPTSLCASIDVLAYFTGKKILVLGTMGELGPEEQQMHFDVGKYAKYAGVDELLTFGNLTKHADLGFGEGAKHFTSKAELITYLKPLLHPNVCVLVKGSMSMKMWEVVEAIT